VFADIRSDTYNLDVDKLAGKITERTKAIIAVDFTGQPVEIDRLEMLARDKGLILIQDAAHSIGAEFGGRKVGSFADMTMFSFHPVKHVTTGEGGVIVTDREDLRDQLLLFRNHGMTKDPARLLKNDGPWYYEMHELGYNYRMTDIQAALGLSQMSKLNRFIERRRDIASTYNEAFKGLPGIKIPYQHPSTNSSWHLYVLQWDERVVRGGRDRAFEELRVLNIGVQVHYIPVYRQPYYQSLGFGQAECPEAESYYRSALSIPLFPAMTEWDVEDVIEAVRKTLSRLTLQ
jgi:dTDP-4-amino-4,6-dideoxygalactose transaminase